jgi:hypothetical protein
MNRNSNMTPPVTRALIYMTGRNCERYVRAAIESIAWQTHAHIHVLFVDDCSDDGTAASARALLAEHFPGRHTLVRNPEPWGKARNAHAHLREALPHGDFVAILDADDQLIRASIVAEMAAHYAAGHDVVWTNFETDRGGIGANGPLDPLLPPRGQGWRSSHFFSFRAELFANVPEDYLRDDRGEWFPAACDFAIAFPVLDQTRRYKFMPVRAYRYTVSNPSSHHNSDPQSIGLSSRRQRACAQQVLAKPALACTRWAFGDQAGADEAMLGLRQHLRSELQVLGQKMDGLGQMKPAAAPEPAGAGDTWSQAAAATLAQRCPELLALMMDGHEDKLSIRDAWRWWTWLQACDRPPTVLEVGAGPLAAPVRAMVQALGGRFLSVCADRERAVALWARLETAGLPADVIHVPLADAAIGGHQGRIADLSALPSEATGYDVLLTSIAAAGAVPTEAILALPMAIDRLDPRGFRVCLWAPDEAALRKDVASAWSALAPELQFTNNAFAGQAVCVHAA